MKRGMEPFLVLNRTISSKSVCNYAYIFGIGTPKRFYTLLKKVFLWVLYRTLGSILGQ